MNREYIEKAANAKYEDNTFAYKGFIEGAEWRINSLWHETSELPKIGKHILVHFKSGSLTSFFVSSDIMEVFKKFDVIRWAYVSDLLPERKEETK